MGAPKGATTHRLRTTGLESPLTAQRPRLRALAALLENSGHIPSTHMAHNHC